MSRVFLVIVESGEYSDYRWDAVKAFAARDDAQSFIESLAPHIAAVKAAQEALWGEGAYSNAKYKKWNLRRQELQAACGGASSADGDASFRIMEMDIETASQIAEPTP